LRENWFSRIDTGNKVLPYVERIENRFFAKAAGLRYFTRSDGVLYKIWKKVRLTLEFQEKKRYRVGKDERILMVMTS